MVFDAAFSVAGCHRLQLSRQFSDLLFQAADGLPQFREFSQSHHLFCGLLDRSGWGSQIQLSAWQIPMSSGLGCQRAAIAKVNMIADSHLTGTDNVLASRDRPRESNL